MYNNVLPQAQIQGYSNHQALPDDTDRISGMIGYDVNNYIWGDGQIRPKVNLLQGFTQGGQQAPTNYYPVQKGKSSPIGAFLLGALVTGAGVLIAKAKGHNISISSIKNFITSIFNRP